MCLVTVCYFHVIQLIDLRLARKARKAAAEKAEQKEIAQGRLRIWENEAARGKAEAKARGDYTSPSRNPYSPTFRVPPRNLTYRDFM